jgi:hypothetical protein
MWCRPGPNPANEQGRVQFVGEAVADLMMTKTDAQ